MADNESRDRLREQMTHFPSEPFLLTVTAETRPHCGTVTVHWDPPGRCLLVSPPSSWPESEVAGYRQVSMLWPATDTGGYSLIVDGTASSVQSGSASLLSIDLERAVLYRRDQASSSTDSSGRPDCVRILDRERP